MLLMANTLMSFKLGFILLLLFRTLPYFDMLFVTDNVFVCYLHKTFYSFLYSESHLHKDTEVA